MELTGSHLLLAMVVLCAHVELILMEDKEWNFGICLH